MKEQTNVARLLVRAQRLPRRSVGPEIDRAPQGWRIVEKNDNVEHVHRWVGSAWRARQIPSGRLGNLRPVRQARRCPEVQRVRGSSFLATAAPTPSLRTTKYRSCVSVTSSTSGSWWPGSTKKLFEVLTDLLVLLRRHHHGLGTAAVIALADEQMKGRRIGQLVGSLIDLSKHALVLGSAFPPPVEPRIVGHKDPSYRSTHGRKRLANLTFRPAQPFLGSRASIFGQRQHRCRELVPNAISAYVHRGQRIRVLCGVDEERRGSAGE